MRRGGMTSITFQLRRSVASIAVLLAVPAVIGLVVMLIYSSRTQAMIRRMDAAAGMKPVLENTIAENLFSVAAGRTTFAKSGVEQLIAETDQTLDMLLGETQGSGQMQLTIARRTMDTLEQYALRIRDGMAAGTPISEIESIVDEVRDVGRLVTDMLDAFTTEEIANAARSNRWLQSIVIAAAAAELLLLLFAFMRTGKETRKLTDSIHSAIYSMEETVRRIAEGQFGDRVKGVNVEELKELGEQVNQMADRLETLIEQVRQNQDNLARAELRTLQAQINPHFLYNTLDTVAGGVRQGRRSGPADPEPERLLPDFPVLRRGLDSGGPGAEACVRLPQHPENPVPGYPGLQSGPAGRAGGSLYAEAPASAAGGKRPVSRHQKQAGRRHHFRPGA